MGGKATQLSAALLARIARYLEPRSEGIAPPEPLTEKQLRERLAINSPELMHELLALVQTQISSEVGRQTRLDAKSASLLTASGLSLTVAFTFGGLLISQPKVFSAIIIVAFGFAIFSGLFAAIYAVRALRVSDEYQTAHEETLFDASMLQEANEPPALRHEDMTDAEKRVFGVMEYRKFIVPHLWTIVQDHRGIHERKGALIRRGQFCLLGFLGALLVVCVFVVHAVSSTPR